MVGRLEKGNTTSMEGIQIECSAWTGLDRDSKHLEVFMKIIVNATDPWERISADTYIGSESQKHQVKELGSKVIEMEPAKWHMYLKARISVRTFENHIRAMFS